MKTIKIIDLLNKIANDEEVPKKIKWGNHLFERVEYGYKELNGTLQHKLSDYLDMDYTDLNDEVGILDEEDEFEDIEEITLEGQVIGYGILSKWLGSRQTDKEKKLCSAIECLGTGLNVLIKNQKKIIEKLNKE